MNNGWMQLIKGDGPDDGEPMDRWTVTRTWRGVEAATAMDAVFESKKRDHDEVRTVREDTSARLYDTEIVTLRLCRFTGAAAGADRRSAMPAFIAGTPTSTATSPSSPWT